MVSRILEVAIGLSYTFLVFTLLCSAAREAVASMFQTRSMVLVDAVLQLLHERPPKSRKDNWKEGALRLLRQQGGYEVDRLKNDRSSLAYRILRHPLITGMAQQGRMPSYIPSQVFARAFIDAMVSRHGLPQGTDAVTPMLARLNPKLAEVLRSLVPGGARDLTALEQAVQFWFDTVMERVSGWYKRRSQVALFLIGLVLAAAINLDAITLAQRLWVDSTVAVQLANEAQGAVSGSTAAARPAANNEANVYLDQLKSVPIGWTGQEHGSWGLRAAGWLVAAFAASLGAPFWFQGVGRLLALRAAGARPHEDATAGVSPRLPVGTGLMQRVNVPVKATDASSSGTSMARNGYENEVLTRDDFVCIQERLGLPPEQRSGWPDGATRERILGFQRAHGFPPDGVLTPALVYRLMA